jgi:hypothetical protein
LLPVSLGLMPACERAVASHCFNRQRDATCQARGDDLQFCSRCEATNDGCVGAPVPADVDCAMQVDAGTSTAGVETGTVTSTTSSGGASETTAHDASGDTTTGPQPIECGNGVVEGTEVCDGADLGGLDCAMFSGVGELSCKPDCTLDTSDCNAFNMCGDGIVTPPEECDGTNLDGMTCADVTRSSPGGQLTCSGCLFNTTPCCKEAGAQCGEDAECCSRDCGKLLQIDLLGTCK